MKLQKFFQNLNRKKSVQKVERIKSRAAKKCRQKTFLEQYLRLYEVASGLSWVAQGVSFLTTWLVLQIILSPILGISWAGWVVAGLLAFAAENIKREIAEISVFSALRLNFWMVPVFVAVSGLSVFAAWIGAKEIPKYFPASAKTVSYISLDSISKTHNRTITAAKSQAATFAAETKNGKTGRVSYNSREAYSKLQEAVVAAQEAKRQALEEARAENARLKAEQETKGQNNKADQSKYIQLAAIGFEFIYLICSFFCNFYNFRVSLEAQEEEEEEQTKSVVAAPLTNGKKFANLNQTEPSRPQIGFDPNRNFNPLGKSEKKQKEAQRTCLCCGASIDHKRADAKFCGSACRWEYARRKQGQKHG